MAGEIQLNSVTLATESGGVASIDSSVNIKGPLNASGSAPIYACRAWVNFDGTFGTSPFTEANGGIRASGNVSSVTELAAGIYKVNIATALPDAHYSSAGCLGSGFDRNIFVSPATTADNGSVTVQSTTSCCFKVINTAASLIETEQVHFQIFR